MATIKPTTIAALTHAPVSEAGRAELLKFAASCQVSCNHTFILTSIAGPLAGLLEHVFRGLAIIPTITEHSRLQVWFAVLSRQKPALQEMGDEALDQFVCDLLQKSDRALIIDAYSDCPQGYLSVIKALGPKARSAHLYRDIHCMITAAPKLAARLLVAAQNGKLCDDTIRMMHNLPQIPQSIDAASHFDRYHNFYRWFRAYLVVSGRQTVCETHVKQMAAGETPSHLLERLYLALLFPAPIVTGISGLTHITHGAEMMRVGRTYQNCIGCSSAIGDALRGVRQFFLWKANAESPVVILSLLNDGASGYILEEMKCASNEEVPDSLSEDLCAKLATCGVAQRSSTETLMRPFLSLVEDEFEYALADLAA